MSLVELLVSLAIIGLMVSMLMPAIHAVRMSSQRTVCVNHKSQINLSLQMYADANHALPPAPRPGFPSGWTWEILPFREEGAMQAALAASQPVGAGGNASAARSRPPLYRCAFASSWRSSDVVGVLPSDFLAVVSESKPGARKRNDTFFAIIHSPETNTLPWPVAAELSGEEYGRLRSQDAWKVWHPAASGTGLSGLIDGDGAD